MPDLSSMQMTFHDEFDDRSISLTGTQGGAATRWADTRNQFRYGYADGGYGDSSFVDPASGYDPFKFDNGVLTITARLDPTSSGNAGWWESGLLTTQNTFSQTYGYFEMRADLSNQPGSWDAFWLLAANGTTTDVGWQELDIVEHYGDDDAKIYSTIHTTDPVPNQNWWQNLEVMSTMTNPDGFHTYGLMWTPDTLGFYIDGVLMGTKPTPVDMHTPMYLIANLATQSNADPNGPPIEMKIDYIRVYALPGTTTPQHAPVVTSAGGGTSATVSAPENRLAVSTVTATDPDGGALAYSISGGADAALFAINANTGALTFKTAQDFEKPADADHNAIYEVTVRVSDGSLSTTQAIHVTLSNVVETQTRILTSGADQFIAPSDDNWTIYAGLGADTVTTRGGNDTIYGGGGADTMKGGAGNDTYVIDNSAQHVVEAAGGGTDYVMTQVSYTLDAGQEIERLDIQNRAGTAAINLTGNAFANILSGNAGANILDGGAGNDTLIGYGGADTLKGGTGNDIFIVDNARQKVIEAVGGGTDSVLAQSSYTLGAGQEIEILKTFDPTATTAINLTGNAFANTITGNAGANILNGGGGNDVLDGGAGNDTLYGGGGAATMKGGAGNDIYVIDNAAQHVVEAVGGGTDYVLTQVSYKFDAGQEIERMDVQNRTGTAAINLTGNDSFIFGSALNAVTTIADFTIGQDVFQLGHAIFAAAGAVGTLAAIAFHVGTAANTAAERIIYNSATGNLYYDDDGIGGHAAIQFAHVAANLALTNASFHIF